MTKKFITYTRRGLVERGIGGSYKWFEGYSETSPTGGVYYPFMTKPECKRDAKAQHATAKFTEEIPQ